MTRHYTDEVLFKSVHSCCMQECSWYASEFRWQQGRHMLHSRELVIQDTLASPRKVRQRYGHIVVRASCHSSRSLHLRLRQLPFQAHTSRNFRCKRQSVYAHKDNEETSENSDLSASSESQGAPAKDIAENSSQDQSLDASEEPSIDLLSLNEVQETSRAALDEQGEASSSGRNPTLIDRMTAYLKTVFAMLRKSWRKTMAMLGSVLGFIPWFAREMQLRQLRSELKKDPQPERQDLLYTKTRFPPHPRPCLPSPS